MSNKGKRVWKPAMARKFLALAAKQALGKASAAEIRQLEELQAIRRQVVQGWTTTDARRAERMNRKVDRLLKQLRELGEKL